MTLYEDIPVINLYSLPNITSKYKNQNRPNHQEKFIIVENFNRSQEDCYLKLIPNI